MNYNTIIQRCGLAPENFSSFEVIPTVLDDGTIIYFIHQSIKENICPTCESNEKVVIHDYYHTKINITVNGNQPEYLDIKRVRHYCKNCKKSFTVPLTGIAEKCSIANNVKRNIYFDFSKNMTFKQIADNYSVSQMTVINLFDELVPEIPRKKLGKVLCIDEFKFSKLIDQKYCAILVDFKSKRVIDIIKNRQIHYLNDYFNKIPNKERDEVEFFVSDMYKPYSIIKKAFFPNAIHIIDLFHVVKQLTEAINKIRNNVMKHQPKGSAQYSFMKRYWKLFLCSRNKIPDRTYTHKKTKTTYHLYDLHTACLNLSYPLQEAYEVLQDILKYAEQKTSTTIVDFIKRNAQLLIDTNNVDLVKVGKTYLNWLPEISNALLPEVREARITNGIAEGFNNSMKTIIKNAYGYCNFERFRKRALLISNKKWKG